MKRALIFLSVFCLGMIHAQNGKNHPAELVSVFQTVNQFEKIDILVESNEKFDLDIPDDLIEYEIFSLNTVAVQELRSSSLEGFTLSLNLAKETFELDLVQVNLFADDFIVTEEPSGIQYDVDLGIHYRGVVRGFEGSIVAISLSDSEVSGIISIPGRIGNMVLGKLDNSMDHILYHDNEIKEHFDFVCGTQPSQEVKDLKLNTQRSMTTRCPEIYIDLGKDVHDNKGGILDATSYMTSLFNQVAILYANDNIDILLAGITVWSTQEPFAGLDAYRAYRNSNPTIGDLNAYVNYAFGGGVAWVDGLCSSFNYSVSGINPSFNNIPSYSWSVEVLAHELGHNLGSQHTHACEWNGNSTAIDGCGENAGYSEGCSGANPPGGGTVMSYCHLTPVGINFSLGFGPQPAARIISTIEGSTCVEACTQSTCTDGTQNGSETGVDCGGPDCPACPTCSDGIQNGDEEGVDCGGPDCPPCPCLDNGLTLTLTFDDYPEETSWTLVSVSGAIVASGGTYGTEPDQSTLIIELCVPDGCYELNIFDSANDGMCCEFGIGSYSLQNTGGTVLASGATFTSSETTNLCLNFNPNADCTVFESAPVDLTKSFDPVGGVEDRVQVKFFKSSPSVSYASVDSAACDILFWKKRFLDPETGQVYGDPIANPDSILLSQVQKSNDNPLFKWPVKYRADGANNSKRVEPNFRYQWKTRCYCQKGAGPVSPWSDTKNFNTPNFDPSSGQNTSGIQVPDTDYKGIANTLKVDMYPNPTEGILNLTYKSRKGEQSIVQVMDMFGKQVYSENILGSGDKMQVQLDMSNLAIGNYILSIHNELQTTTERFTVTR